MKRMHPGGEPWQRVGTTARVDRVDQPTYNIGMMEKVALQPVDYARLAVDAASEGQASDVTMLDIGEISAFADYFVILTAESSRQIESLREQIEKDLETSGAVLHHREGSPQGGWVLLDFGDVVVHLFAPDEREYYHLEGAWPGATEVVRLQ